MANAGNEESVWNILDKIIQASIHFKDTFRPGKSINNSRMTVKLCDYELSCGYTQDVHNTFFARANKLNIRRREEICSKFQIQFENETKGYNLRKMSFSYIMPPPLLYLYFRAADIALIAENDDEMPLGVVENGVAAWPRNILVSYMDDDHIEIKKSNNRMCLYHKIPQAKEIIEDFEHFRHSLTAARMSTILAQLAGDTAQGVTFLTRLIFGINANACKEGMRQCGAAVFSKLDASQTLALQYGCGLSASQRIYVARFLKYHNHMKPVLSGEKVCAAVRPKYIVPPQFGVFTYTPAEKASALDQAAAEVRVEYWHKSLYRSTLATLDKWRDEVIPLQTTKALGTKQGVHGVKIPIVILGDHGGDPGQGETKILELVLLREGGHAANYQNNIAFINGPEEHEILKFTVMPALSQDIDLLVSSKVLLITWANQCDYVIIPYTLALNGIQCVRLPDGHNTLRALWADGHADFTRLDIPEQLAYTIVEFLLFLGGDIKWQFTNLGRDGFSSNKCSTCKICYEGWQNNPSIGILFDTAGLKREWDELEAMCKLVNPDTTYHETKDFIKEYVRVNTSFNQAVVPYIRSSYNGCDILVHQIPIGQWLAPPLHIMLGIGNNLLKRFVDFISNNLEKKDRSGMQRLFTDMLGGFNVVHQKYYTQTLVGGDVKRMLEKHEGICNEAQVVLETQEHWKDDIAADIDIKIQDFISNMRKLLLLFSVICSLMSQDTALSVVELNIFCNICRVWVKMWRKYFPGQGVTPKMHMLESHVPAQMIEFGCLGDKSEAAAERIHHQGNITMRVLSPLRVYKRKKEVQILRDEQSNTPEVIIAQRTAEEGTRRRFSPESLAQRAVRKIESSVQKQNRFTQANDAANAFLIEFPE